MGATGRSNNNTDSWKNGPAKARRTPLTAVKGVRRAFAGPFFHESVLLFDRPVGPILAALANRGILGGLELSELYPELGYALLVCATETKTQSDINSYVTALGEAVQAVRAA